MFSLYQLLLTQHARQLRARRYSEEIVTQIRRHLEGAVLEENLAALVIECLPLNPRRSLRDVARINELGWSARYSFFFVTEDDALNSASIYSHTNNHTPVIIKRDGRDTEVGQCVVISSARFSALLVSVPDESGGEIKASLNRVIWTFDPDVVYSALEYLLARVRAEHQSHADLLFQHASQNYALSVQDFQLLHTFPSVG